MLLGNKKIQDDEQGWCVVLKPIVSEMDKRKIVSKISQTFSLADDEAADLVSNTPIILLDNLTRNVASGVKDYFELTGVEMLLTNDAFQKRKYYRTIWPTPPSLTFLHHWQQAGKKVSEQERMAPEEALNEIRSLTGTEIAEGLPDVQESRREEPNSAEQSKFLRDIEQWKKAYSSAQEELMRLREALHHHQKDPSAQGRVSPDADAKLRDREKDIKEVKALLSHAEEKYEVLRGEYRQARSIFEEKIATAEGDAERWKKKAKEIEESHAAFEREKQSLKDEMSKKEDLCRRLEEEKAKIKSLSEERNRLSSELEGDWKSRVEVEAQKTKLLEMARQDLEKSQARYLHDLEMRSKELRNAEAKNLELAKTLEDLKAEYARQEKNTQGTLKQTEAYEKELESARKKVAELTAQIEQREALQKKIQVSNLLVEKEGQLKGLVKEQERIEVEIRNREEAIRKILAEQESVEKEIIEAKEAERNVSEQLKREASREHQLRIHKDR